jgi:histidine triad (HIT) family protein
VSDCPFCTYTGPILENYGEAFVIEPLNPVAPGHVLVIPRVHLADAVTSPVATGQVAEYAARYARDAGVGPCNIITSVGTLATQTVFHLHVHVVPRRAGDGLPLPWSPQRQALT